MAAFHGTMGSSCPSLQARSETAKLSAMDLQRKMCRAIASALTLCVAACTADPKPQAVTAPVPDPSGCVWQLPVAKGKIAASKLVELSGLAASRTHAGLFWAHNDSGNKPYLFLVGGDGTTKGIYNLVGAPNTDWEDIAVGPCQAPTVAVPAPPPCVWVGDIGDNTNVRPSVALVRFAEPTVLPTAKKAETPLDVPPTEWQTVAFTYPEGSQNAESLALLPDGRAIVLTKRDDATSVVYRVDGVGALQVQKAEIVAEHLGVLHVAVGTFTSGTETRVTGADLNLAGTALIVRTYGSLQLLRNAQNLAGPAGTTMTGQIAAWKALALPSPAETQGESVAWDADETIWAAGEGDNPALYQVICK